MNVPLFTKCCSSVVVYNNYPILVLQPGHREKFASKTVFILNDSEFGPTLYTNMTYAGVRTLTNLSFRTNRPGQTI